MALQRDKWIKTKLHFLRFFGLFFLVCCSQSFAKKRGLVLITLSNERFQVSFIFQNRFHGIEIELCTVLRMERCDSTGNMEMIKMSSKHKRKKVADTLLYHTERVLKKIWTSFTQCEKKRNNSCEYFKLEKLLYQFVRIKQTTFIFSRRIVKKPKKNNFSDSSIRLQYLKHNNRKFDYGLNSNWNSN